MKSLIIVMVCAIATSSVRAQLELGGLLGNEAISALLAGSYAQLGPIELQLGNTPNAQAVRSARASILTSQTDFSNVPLTQMALKPRQYLDVQNAAIILQDRVTALSLDLVNIDSSSVSGVTDAVNTVSTTVAAYAGYER